MDVGIVGIVRILQMNAAETSGEGLAGRRFYRKRSAAVDRRWIALQQLGPKLGKEQSIDENARDQRPLDAGAGFLFNQ